MRRTLFLSVVTGALSAFLTLGHWSTAAASKAAGLDFYRAGQFAAALEELRWEAMQGDAEAQLLVGRMYQQGQGTAKDSVKAAYYLQDAARQGNAEAFAELAELYLSGQGLPQDDISAAFNAQQAASAGVPAGQVLLGKLYLEGRGVERSPQQAVTWFRAAAQAGHPEGQYLLAQMLERGEGGALPRDPAAALRWYQAAAGQGFKAAGEAVQRLRGAAGQAPSVAVRVPDLVPARVTGELASLPQPTPAPVIPAALQPATPPTSTTQKRRIALLIANQDYRDNALDLQGPVNDARLIAGSLQAAGFTVITKTNLSLVQMNREIASFLAGVDRNTVSLVYYSGHGAEVGGRNYLIPSDFQMTPTLSSAEAVAQSVDIADLYAHMTAQAAGSLNITILDACRNNPFRGRGLKGLGEVGGVKALVVPAGDDDGTIETFTAYAASSGEVAQDGERNGPYAEALARQIGVPGQVLEVTFRKVREEVSLRTGKLQNPTSYAAVSSEFIFTPAR